MMTLFVTIYMSLMGPKGLKEVNEQSYAGAHYLHDELIKTGKFEDTFKGQPFCNEFCVRTTLNLDALQKKFEEKGILGGIRLKKKGMEDCLLLAVTEKRTKTEIDNLVSIVKEA